jgi:protein-S-isoprenylcysteine O-methyltransferase Ste14
MAWQGLDRLRRITRQELGAWVGRAGVTGVTAAFFGIFLTASWRFYCETGALVGLLAVISNGLLMVCLLARRAPMAVSGSLRHWLVAGLTQLLPLLIRPVAGATPICTLLAAAGQAIGLIVMVGSVLSLNRSIGIVAANRGVKTSGSYAWVRHPLYAGEITFFVSLSAMGWPGGSG